MSDDKKKFGKGRPKGGGRPDFRKGEGKPYGDRPERAGPPKRDPRPPHDAKGKPYKPRDKHSSAPRSGMPAVSPSRGEVASGERIAKRLARAGVASRRDAEALIEAGRVSVNGQVLTSPAVNVAPDDRIAIDGEPIPAIERTRLFLFHKPAGLVTTNRDPEGRQTVFDVLPKDLPRLMTIGRLDINTEGLLLLTNDGGLSRVLELPATGWLRRYRVRVHGKVDETALKGLKDGIAVDGVFYGSIEAELEREQGSNAWLTIGLREGKNREVKNVLGALGLEVTRLIRISYGPFQLGELPESTVVELKGRMLRDQLGPRLIAEAGADFDAPITTPFSNKPVSSKPEPETPKRGDKPRREPGGRKPRPDERRERALDRLSTKPERGPKRGERPERGERREEPRRPRNSNVWMAPGARPLGKKKEEEAAAAAAERSGERTYRKRPEGTGKPGRGFGGKPRRERAEGREERSPRQGRSERETGPKPEARPRREEGRPRPFGEDGKPRPFRKDGKPGDANKPRPKKKWEPAETAPPPASGRTSPSRGRGTPRPASGDRKAPRPDRPPRGKGPGGAPGKGPRKGPGKGPRKP